MVKLKHFYDDLPPGNLGVNNYSTLKLYTEKNLELILTVVLLMVVLLLYSPGLLSPTRFKMLHPPILVTCIYFQ